jgi:hypothetical protein
MEQAAQRLPRMRAGLDQAFVPGEPDLPDRIPHCDPVIPGTKIPGTPHPATNRGAMRNGASS